MFGLGRLLHRSTDTAQANGDGTAPAPMPNGSSFMSSTGAEYEEFLKLMREGKRPFRKPGISVTQEFELWLTHRAKADAAALTQGAKA